MIPRTHALPTRRQSETLRIHFDGKPITVCIGYDHEGQPREVFADGAKEGSGVQSLLDDVCVVVSIALQHGIDPSALGKSLGAVPAHFDGEPTERPASAVGAIIACLCPSEDVRALSDALHAATGRPDLEQEAS